VDPSAIHPYQEYINYLEDIVIFNLRQELVSALASPDPTSTNSDDGPVTGPMVVNMNTGCDDEYCCYSCHEKKDNTPPATPPSDPTPPPTGYYMPSQQSGGLLTVNSCIKVRLDLQADKSPIVVKGPFFPRVVNPRYRIYGTNV
jgi:hypothetical protein